MSAAEKFVVGTSGYSFKDWVGPFYPPGTQQGDMLEQYRRSFSTVELNFTFYSMPVARTLENMVRLCGSGFDFWVKANQEITHKANTTVIQEFDDNLAPMRAAGRLAGVVLQFPQSFQRTEANRRYLARVAEMMSRDRLAVEFRHESWDHPATYQGLRQRDITLIVPDAPAVPNLFRPPPMLTSRVGYLRLHSRNADKWYAGRVLRYDYTYNTQELRDVLAQWQPVADYADRVYVFFNNCHGGSAARNAVEFQELLRQASHTG